MTTNRTIYCLGDLNVDVLLGIDSYPEVGGDRRSEHLTLEIGGSVTNSAMLLSNLGWRPTLLASRGDDLFGDYTQQALERAGINLDFLQIAENETTGLMFIPVTADGQRTLFGSRGANLKLRAEELPADFNGAAALLISGYALLDSEQAQASRRSLELALAADVFLAMDSAYEPPLAAPEAFTPYLEHLDLLMIGEAEVKSLAGLEDVSASVNSLLDQGVGIIALKMGARGSRLYTTNDKVELPALDAQVVDTTGAGDNFSAGLLHGMLAGLSPQAAGLLGSAAAAHVISLWGAGRSAGAPADLAKILQRSQSELPTELQSHSQAAVDHVLSLNRDQA